MTGDSEDVEYWNLLMCFKHTVFYLYQNDRLCHKTQQCPSPPPFQLTCHPKFISLAQVVPGPIQP